jgi:hypothetical protein
LNKRDFIKIGGVGIGAVALRALPLAGVGALALVSSGCDIKQSDIVIDSLQEALPIIKDLVPGSAQLVVKAIAVAKELRDAIKANNGTALGFLKQLISPDGLMNQISDTLNLIQNVNQRRILSGVLLLANIALRAISGKLAAVPAGVVAVAIAGDAGGASMIEKAANSLEPTLLQLRFN